MYMSIYVLIFLFICTYLFAYEWIKQMGFHIKIYALVFL